MAATPSPTAFARSPTLAYLCGWKVIRLSCRTTEQARLTMLLQKSFATGRWARRLMCFRLEWFFGNYTTKSLCTWTSSDWRVRTAQGPRAAWTTIKTLGEGAPVGRRPVARRPASLAIRRLRMHLWPACASRPTRTSAQISISSLRFCTCLSRVCSQARLLLGSTTAASTRLWP